MKKEKKYSIQIGKQVFESEETELFCANLTDVENILVADLPLNVTLQMKELIDDSELSLIRKDAELVEIFISEFASADNWDKYVTVHYYYILKEQLILAHRSIKPQIHFHSVDLPEVNFSYSIKLTALDIGEAIKRALEINKSYDDRIDYANEKALTCIQIVLGGGLQIKLPDYLFDKNKNGKNSKV